MIATSQKFYRDGHGDTEINAVREEFRNNGKHMFVIIDLADGRSVELNMRSDWKQGCKMVEIIQNGAAGVFGQWGRIE